MTINKGLYCKLRDIYTPFAVNFLYKKNLPKNFMSYNILQFHAYN